MEQVVDFGVYYEVFRYAEYNGAIKIIFDMALLKKFKMAAFPSPSIAMMYLYF